MNSLEYIDWEKEEFVCGCGFTRFEKGYSLDCHSCRGWYHGLCVGISRTQIPPDWTCAKCIEMKRKEIELINYVNKNRVPLNEESAAILVQSKFRQHKAKTFVRRKQFWHVMQKGALPLMHERVRQMRAVYDHSGLVKDAGHDKVHTITFKKQVQRMGVLPAIVVSLWLAFPMAGYDSKFENRHYSLFLIFWFCWLLSACFFFFSFFNLVIQIKYRVQMILGPLFSCICVLTHVIIFYSRGGDTFFDTCIGSSFFHLCITIIGVIQILTFVIYRIVTQVQRAEKSIQTKQKAAIVEARVGTSVKGKVDTSRFGATVNTDTPSTTFEIDDNKTVFEAHIMHFGTEGHQMDKKTQLHLHGLQDNKRKKHRAKVAPVLDTQIPLDEQLSRPDFSSKRLKKRRDTLKRFDDHARVRVSVASRVFLRQKILQMVLTALTATWAAVFFWCLSIFTSYFVTYANDPQLKVVLTLVFHFMTKFFEVTGLMVAGRADLIALNTLHPGHALEHMQSTNEYNNYSAWRLSHRMSVVFISFKRSFYISLFAEAVDLVSFVSMGFASLVATVSTKMLVSSRRFHHVVSKRSKRRRDYNSMGKEHMFNNLVDGFASIVFYIMFVSFFVITKATENKSIYPYLAHSEKDWSILLLLFLYTAFTVVGCYLFHVYLQNVMSDVDMVTYLKILFQMQDKHLWIAVIFILVHVGMDPYYSLAVTNMSRTLPCEAAPTSGLNSSNI